MDALAPVITPLPMDALATITKIPSSCFFVALRQRSVKDTVPIETSRSYRPTIVLYRPILPHHIIFRADNRCSRHPLKFDANSVLSGTKSA